jgi:hypothetical protein
VPVRLLAGRDQALAVLLKYVPDFKFDVAEADQQMREIDAWAERNNDALRAIVGSTATELPKQLELHMGSSRAQQFVLSSFTKAAEGLGPWASGAVGRLAREGQLIDERWARIDAAHRLQMFAIIVKMEQEGALHTIFVPPAGTSGLGALPLWFVAVVLVIFAAAIVTTIVLWRRMDLNNRLMREICLRAQAEGDQETVRQCLELTKGLQAPDLGVGRAVERVGYAVVAAGLVYAGFRYLMPWALGEWGKAKRGESDWWPA